MDYNYVYQQQGQKQEAEHKLSDFIIEKELGKGNFSTVYLVKYKINNNLYSMKEIKSGRYKNELEILKVQKKIKLLQTLENRHVIIYFSSFCENGNLYIITEYMNGGNLNTFFKKAKEKGELIDEKRIWDILIQVLIGLDYLHNKKLIIHRNIKPDNILMDTDGNVKISDLDSSAVFGDSEDYILIAHNSRIYMSPEMVNGGNYNFKTDVYTLGLTFFNLMSSDLQDKNILQNNEIFVNVNQGAILPDSYSKELQNFIKKLLIIDANDRPTTYDAYIQAVFNYSYNYVEITSILTLLRCFLSIKSFDNYFQSKRVRELIENDGKKKYLFTKCIKYAFDSIYSYDFDYKRSRSECLKVRILFYIVNENLLKNHEINVQTFFSDFCINLSEEINKLKDYNLKPKPGNNTINEEYMNIKNESIDESNEIKVMESACKRLQEDFRSKISEQLYFILKTTYQCIECYNKIKITTSIQRGLLVFPERAAYRLCKRKLNITDLFRYVVGNRLYEDTEMNCKYCNRCQKKVKCFRRLYSCPLNLILLFEYSNNNKFELQIDEYIDLSDFVDRKDINKTKYRLIGAIFNEQFENEPKKYVSYTKERNGQWKYFNGTYLSDSNFNEIQNHDNVEILFYASL